MVCLDTLSGLFPQFQEEPADEFWLLESASFVGKPLQGLVHLGRRRRESQRGEALDQPLVTGGGGLLRARDSAA